MFYIDPPKGQVALHVLENCVFTRIEYLRLLDINRTDSFNGNFEYLLENSICDSIGHFTLRLISSTLPEFWPYWIKRETMLLEQRLNHLSVRQIHRLFRNIIKRLNNRDNNKSLVVKALLEFGTHFLKPHVFNHITRKDHNNDEGKCREYRCQVPFPSVCDLVRQRKIDLCQGHATVLCSEWKTVLKSLFKNFIIEETARQHRISLIEHVVSTDPRLTCMSERIRKELQEIQVGQGAITARNIDTESSKFPPCMRHLHATLREKHRLGHHARFYYSLFLKECGMKLSDAIDYWKEEYSKAHTCKSGCTHSWQSDGKKFLYSIRHLYGLEGARKNYKTPNCKMICTEVAGLRYEGGCPFKHFDSDTLKIFLQTCMNDTDVEQQLKHVLVQGPEVACSSFLKTVHKDRGENLVIYSPVQYYTKVREIK